MEPWVSRSRPGLQLSAAVGALVVGALLMVLTRNSVSAGANEMAAFGLGALLAALGLGGVATTGLQTITVDPHKRRIDIQDLTVLGVKRSSVTFAQIAQISIGYLGKKSNYAQTYYLILHLTDGREYPLFAPGRFFAGASSRSTAEGWRDRIETLMRSGTA